MPTPTATIVQFLEGLHFPVSKQQIIQQARQKNAPPEVLGLLNQLPEKQFNSLQELQQLATLRK